MKFTLTDGDARMLLGHAVKLAAGYAPPDAPDFVAKSSRAMLASLLGLKSISFDVNEFGLLAARCEDCEAISPERMKPALPVNMLPG